MNELPLLSALQQPQANFIAEAIPHIVWMSSADGSTQFVNRLGMEFAGLIDDGNSRWNWLTLVHAQEATVAAVAWQQAIVARCACNVKCRLNRADGAWLWFEIVLVPRLDIDGKVLGWIGTASNIDQVRQNEINLRRARRDLAGETSRRAEEQFRRLADQLIAGMYVLQKGRLCYVNHRVAQIFGYTSPSDIVGLQAMDLVAGKDRAALEQGIQELVDDHEPVIDYTFTGLRRDGTTCEIGAHAAMSTYLGKPAVVGLLQDISEKVRVEQERRHHGRQLETALQGAVDVAMTLVGMRDPYTLVHQKRVGKIAHAIAVELGLGSDRADGIRLAGYLHDIGKIACPTEILVKPTRLSALEFNLIKGHAGASFDVLKLIEFPWPIAQVALQHHERLDGSGYPQGLRGDQILLEARIVAVADVVESMSSHRPYRASLGVDKALEEIARGRGTLYDETVVDACLRLFQQKEFTVPDA